MIEEINQEITPLIDFPKRTSYTSSSAYALSVETWLRDEAVMSEELSLLVPELNNFIDQTNLTIEDILRVEDLVNNAINYQGDWVAGSYNTGQSVTHNGTDYISKIYNNTDEPPTLNWKAVIPVGKSTFLTKTFTTGEKAIITLPEDTPVATVTVQKEVLDSGIINNDWDVATDGNNYDIEDFSLPTTLTPSAVSGSITLALGTGSFTTQHIGMKIKGNGGEAVLTAVDGSATTTVDFNDITDIPSNVWSMNGIEFTANGASLAATPTTIPGSLGNIHNLAFSYTNISHINTLVLSSGNIVFAYVDLNDFSQVKFKIMDENYTTIVSDVTVGNGDTAATYTATVAISELSTGNITIGHVGGIKSFTTAGVLVDSYNATMLSQDTAIVDGLLVVVYNPHTTGGVKSIKLNNDLTINIAETTVWSISGLCRKISITHITGTSNIAISYVYSTLIRFNIISSSLVVIKASTTIPSVRYNNFDIKSFQNGNIAFLTGDASEKPMLAVYDSVGTVVKANFLISNVALSRHAKLELMETSDELVLIFNDQFTANQNLRYQIYNNLGINTQVEVQIPASYVSPNTAIHSFSSIVNKGNIIFFYLDSTSSTYTTQINGANIMCPINQNLIAKTKTSIDTDFWDKINTMTATETLNNQEVNYVISPDDSTTWKVVKSGSSDRAIARNNLGTWEYNSDTTYANETWTPATTNTETQAIKDALSIQANKMSGTQMANVTDVDFFPTGLKLDSIIALRTTTSSEIPISDGISINYDANSAWEQAQHKVEYNSIQRSDTAIEVESLGNFNFKIKVK